MQHMCMQLRLTQDMGAASTTKQGSPLQRIAPRAYRRRGHAIPHMPVETAKCWRLLKIEPNAWAGGKGSCAVCVDLQAVGALEFLGEFYSLAEGFGPFLRGFWAGFREREGSIFSISPSLQAYAELHALFSYTPLIAQCKKCEM